MCEFEVNAKEGDGFELNSGNDLSRLPQKKKHWLWSNWILLTILAVVSFSIANLLIGSLSLLGLSSIHYFNSGALLISIIYFVYKKEWAKRNPPCGQSNNATKVLTRTWDNRIDWCTILFCIVSAFF